MFCRVVVLRLLLPSLIMLSRIEAAAMDISISIDDAPRGDGVLYQGMQRTQALIATLAAKQVEAAFLCNTGDFQADVQRRIASYAKAGHIIGNHTGHHLDFHGEAVAFEDFTKDVLEVDEKLAGLPGFRRWFRFPYLRQGATTSDRMRINHFLRQHGYRHAYVTVETYDWHLNTLMEDDLRRRGSAVDLGKVKAVYLKIMLDSITFYDDLAQDLLGRSPRHVLLLHENDLNARFLGDLIDLLRAQGHHIISVREAYEDPIAEQRWDLIPYSQRRLRGFARLIGYRGASISPWEDTERIRQYYDSQLAGG